MIKDQSTSEIAEVIRNRRKALYIRKGYISLFIRVALIAVVGYILFTQVFLITQAKGNDMFPAIKDGDLIIAFRLQKDYVKNDIVVYQVGDITYLGRIVARGDDVINHDEETTLLVNGTVQRGEIVYPTLIKDGLDYPQYIMEGNTFILGDHRIQALDSRDFGQIPLEQIEGKIITILRRRGL